MMRIALVLLALAFALPALGGCPPPQLVKPVGSTASLSWTAAIYNTDGSTIAGPVTYEVYDVSGGAPVLRSSGAARAYTVASLPSGTYCWSVTANVGGIASAQSNIGSITISRHHRR